jgi:murein DD-endopeptidase MepM/ murein hydrolase activator NlpD
MPVATGKYRRYGNIRRGWRQSAGNSAAAKRGADKLFYLRLSISAAIIIAAIVLKHTAAPENSPIHSVISKSINEGIGLSEAVNALGRVISGEKDVIEVFNDFTRKITSEGEDDKGITVTEDAENADMSPDSGDEDKEKKAEETEKREDAEKPADNADTAKPADDSGLDDSIITKDYYVKGLAAGSGLREIELLSFQMSEEEVCDDTQPVPFEIPPPSNCSYKKESIAFKYSAPLYGVVTSVFGYRDHPFGGDASFHTGIDIAAKKGTAVKAFAGGRVAETGTSRVYGNYVLMSHPDGFYSFYGHNSKVTVKKGKQVKVGDKIAEVGSTGVSTGPHLHFEVRKGGLRLNPKHYISPDCV